MAQGTPIRAEENDTLQTHCAHCGKPIPTEIGYGLWERETWGLVGYQDGEKKIFPTCKACYEDGWRPPDHAWD